MRRVVECPLCGDRVRLNAPPGRSRVSCPSCKGRFALEGDEAPRRGKKPASRPGGKGLWIALAVGAGVLLVAGGITAFVLLGGGRGVGGGGPLGGPGGNGERVGRVSPDLVAYVPNDAFILRYANVKDQLRALGGDKSQVRLPLDAKQLETDYGPLEDVEE